MVRPNEIWTPASDIESIGEEFRKETETMLKKAALENNVDVETLKFNVNNNGIVNIQSMTEDEMKEAEEKRKRDKFRKQLRISRGLE